MKMSSNMNRFLDISMNNFHESLGNSMKELLSEPDFLDVTLISEDEKMVCAHKLILSSASDFFKRMLLRNFHQRPVVILDGVKYSELRAMVDFMYTGTTKIKEENLDDFMKAGRKFEIKGMMEKDKVLQDNKPQEDQIITDDTGGGNDPTDKDKPQDSETSNHKNDITEAEKLMESDIDDDDDDIILLEDVMPGDKSASNEEDDDEISVLLEEINNLVGENKIKSEVKSENCSEEPEVVPTINIEEHVSPGKKMKTVSPLKCDSCDFEAAEKGNMLKHKFYKHNKPIYSCKVVTCDFKHQREKQVEAHFRQKHV